jgi:hypothetical protein
VPRVEVSSTSSAQEEPPPKPTSKGQYGVNEGHHRPSACAAGWCAGEGRDILSARKSPRDIVCCCCFFLGAGERLVYFYEA